MSKKSAQRRRVKELHQTKKAAPTAPPVRRMRRSTKVALGVLIAFVSILLLLIGVYGIGMLQLYNGAQSDFAFSDSSGVSLQADGTALYEGETYAQRENVYTVLFIGIDRSAERVESGYADEELSLADTLIVASIDLDTAEISLLSIPRDTITTIYTHTREGENNGYLEGQIATQYAYGGDSDDLRNQHTLESVERLLNGLTIDTYVTIDMDDIIAVTDLIGGVPITVPEDEYYCSYTGYEPGQWMLLEGETALQFVQYRDTTVFASCELRVERQKVFLDGAINRLYTIANEDVFDALDIAWQIYQLLDTNVPPLTLALIAPKLLDFTMDTLWMETLPGEASSTDLYEEYYCDTDALDVLILELFFEKAA